MTTPTEIHHFSVFSLAFRHLYSTIEFVWGIRRDVHFGRSPCDYSLFYRHTVITNSVRGSMWEKEAWEHTKCASGVSTSTVALSKDIQSTVLFELTRGLLHAKHRLLRFWWVNVEVSNTQDAELVGCLSGSFNVRHCQASSGQNAKEAAYSNFVLITWQQVRGFHTMHFDSSDSVSPCMTPINMRNANENVRRKIDQLELAGILKKFSSHAQMANTSEVAESVVVMRIGQLFALCKHSPLSSKHGSENVPGSMGSKLLDWSSNHTTLNPIPGVIFTLCCSFRTTRRFWILLHPWSLTQTFRRRGFSSLSSLMRSLHQIPHGCPNERGNSKNILTTWRHARAKRSCVIGDPSVVRFHSSRRLTRDHLSILILLPCISMT